jgi:hypothetical protein
MAVKRNQEEEESNITKEGERQEQIEDLSHIFLCDDTLDLVYIDHDSNSCIQQHLATQSPQQENHFVQSFFPNESSATEQENRPVDRDVTF